MRFHGFMERVDFPAVVFHDVDVVEGERSGGIVDFENGASR